MSKKTKKNILELIRNHWEAIPLGLFLITSSLSSCGVRDHLTKEEAGKPLTYWENNHEGERLALIQKSLNNIEDRLTRIEERLDK